MKAMVPTVLLTDRKEERLLEEEEFRTRARELVLAMLWALSAMPGGFGPADLQRKPKVVEASAVAAVGHSSAAQLPELPSPVAAEADDRNLAAHNALRSHEVGEVGSGQAPAKDDGNSGGPREELPLPDLDSLDESGAQAALHSAALPDFHIPAPQFEQQGAKQ